MAAARVIPNFLQLPIEGIESEGSTEAVQPRGRDAALVRGGRLKAARSLRIEPADAGSEPPSESPAALADNGPVAVPTPRVDPAPAAPVAESGAGSVAGHEARWLDWLAGMGASDEGLRLLESLRERHRESHRRLHLLGRVETELDWLQRWSSAAEDAAAIGIAIWFKDAISDPTRVDNEARSAELARSALASIGADPARSRTVRKLIISTRPDAYPDSADARLLADIERSWLADAPSLVEQREAALRAEFAHVADFIYRRRRVAALRAMQTKPRIFLSAIARRSLEEAARANLSRMLDLLQSGR